jgi:hypothetical protein
VCGAAAAGAFDWDLLLACLQALRAGQAVDIPVYDYVTHSRRPEREHVGRPNVVLVEGILVLFEPRVRALLDLKVFVDEDADTRLSRRGRRALRVCVCVCMYVCMCICISMCVRLSLSLCYHWWWGSVGRTLTSHLCVQRCATRMSEGGT